ncbi:MAG: hypothetical protein JXR22_00355 [Prolixibacteraceae bacterium]|nr:hypothetical protein [Prolixibacteraceae bacterium]
MNKKSVISLFVMVIAMVMFSSCAKLPQVEIDNANAAIAEAEAASAAIYVPASLNAVKDTLNAAMEEIEVQKSKLFKSYKAPKAKLLAVVTLAADVKVQTEARIAELKAQIQATLDETTALNNENKELVAKAPKGKGGTTVLMAIKGEIANIDAAIAESANFEGSENLNVNLANVQALKEQATSINTELKTVIEKYQARR